MSTGADDATQAAVDETIRFLTVRPDGERWIGDAPPWFGAYLFGGVVIAQAVHAATHNAPDGKRSPAGTERPFRGPGSSAPQRGPGQASTAPPDAPSPWR